MALCPAVYLHYKLNSSSGNVAIDSSTNGYNGTLINMEDGDWVVGKLNNCLQFDGVNEWINCQDIADFERTDSFSVDFWIKTDKKLEYIISRRESSGRGWGILLDSAGQLQFDLINTTTTNQIKTRAVGLDVTDNAWHHVVITYSGNSLAAGVHIYVDNIDKVVTPIVDNLAATIHTTMDCNIGSRSNLGTSVPYRGLLDELVIYDKELSVAEVAERWNGGAGTEDFSGNAPNVPNTPNPTNAEAVVEYNRPLNWACTHPDGTGMVYDVYFGTGIPIPLAQADHASLTYNQGAMEALETYYWKIIAKDACGNETSGPTWSFTTRNESPNTPNTPSPAHMTTDVNIDSITITWDCDDNNPSDTLTYDIYFGQASNPPLIKSDHAAKTYALPSMVYDTNYYWKIVARDNHGATTASPIWKFTTKEEGLGGYTGFDIRQNIRGHFCKVEYKPGSELTEYYFTVEDDRGDDIHIPMYLSEEVRSKELKEMPFLDLNLADSIFEVHDIGGMTRRKDAYIDIGLWYTDTDNIDRTDFGNAVIDKLIDYIRSNQHSFTGIDFINVDSVRLVREEQAHQVVYHWIITVHCWYYDFC